MGRPPKHPGAASSSRTGRWQRPATLLYAGLLLTGSVLPARGIPQIIDWSGLFSQDKIAHFGAYAVFAVLLALCFARQGRRRAVVRGAFLAAAFGALMEVLQAVAGTGRSADPVDMVANLIGALLGGLLAFVAWKMLPTPPATVRGDQY